MERWVCLGRSTTAIPSSPVGSKVMGYTTSPSEGTMVGREEEGTALASEGKE